MKKYIPLVLIIIALAGAALWFYTHPSKGTINKMEGDFAVNDKTEISKIILTDVENKKVELARQGGVWFVNGKYPAREELVASLFDAITRVTSLCPVPTAAHNNVIRELLTRHVRTQIFDAKNNLLKSYWVGGPTVDGQNTYMLLEINGEPASRPHMTYIPGFKGYLTPRFNTDEENWRSRVLFNYTRQDINTLRIEYPDDEKKSFIINRVAEDSFEVGPVDKKFEIKETYQQKYIRQYLDFYSSIYIEAYDNSYSLKDSMMQTVPFATITITEKDNSVNKVNLFRMPLNKRSKAQFDENGNEITYDIDHFHASIHDGKDWAIAQYYVLGKLLRNYKDFYFRPAGK